MRGGRGGWVRGTPPGRGGRGGMTPQFRGGVRPQVRPQQVVYFACFGRTEQKLEIQSTIILYDKYSKYLVDVCL